MNRKALIISNPGERYSENYCKGVEIDVENYNNYLLSPLGGAWFQSEIVHLEKPTKRQVDNHIDQIVFSDYSLIIFTGHGYYSKYQESTILELRKDEEYNSLDLRRSSIRRTIILDCCRKVYPEVVFEERMVAKMAEEAKVLNPKECRKYFEIKMEECPKGIVVGYGCSQKETSGDSASRGGYYSSGLFSATKSWFENKNIDLSKDYASFSVVAAHDSAVGFVQRLSGGTQNPDTEKPRSTPYFPFAIMA